MNRLIGSNQKGTTKVMQFNKKQIQAVASAASTDETRYNLCGVHFDGERIVATDGHRLHLIDDLGDCGVKFTIDIVDIKRLIQAMGPKSIVEVQYHAVGDPVVFIFEATRFEFKPLDGEFCNYRQVIPKPDREIAAYVTVNAKLLRDACDAAIKAGTTGGSGYGNGRSAPLVRVEIGEYLTPIVVTSGELKVIVMPFRTKEGDEREAAKKEADLEAAA